MNDAQPASIEEGVLRRLLQSAMIFADCEDQKFRDVAQRISTAGLHAATDAPANLVSLFGLIQARLRNFPALLGAERGLLAPTQVPMTLQFEFINARSQQTVTAGDTDVVLTPFQLRSWQTLMRRHSATLSAPTSAGKSYVLLLYIVEQFKNRHASCVVYVVPTRALINQVSQDLERELKRVGLRDVALTTVPVNMNTADDARALYVFTQERLEALLVEHPHLRLDIVVIDEAQMIAVDARGILLESVIDRVRENSPAAQFIFSGPMIENPDYFGAVFALPDFQSCATIQSPVTQNVIFLDYRSQPESEVTVRLGGLHGTYDVTTVSVPPLLATDLDRLSYLSYLFGRSEGSIVYTGGKADAEKIAIKIANECADDRSDEPSIAELILFVKKHVHKDYALAQTLAKGVGFHYGHMPSLLRRELEVHFKERVLSFLVCTSTLLYGLNLPAKNIFLQKPTTGRGSAIDGPDFWNLAGRAGRLGKGREGNVYLINYGDWDTTPLVEPKGAQVSSALKATLVEQVEDLSSFLGDSEISSGSQPELEITLGKLLLDHRSANLERTLSRYRLAANEESLRGIASQIAKISDEVDIPSEVLNKNIGVSVFRQRDLLGYMVKRLGEVPPEELLPVHPLGAFKDVQQSYLRAFKRIHTYLLRYPSSDKRHSFFSTLAIHWMRGDALPKLISSAIRYHKKNNPTRSVARIIRDTMEVVEADLRFRYVKYFRCYNALLEVAFTKTGFANYVQSIPDIPLFLEVGGSSGAMVNLMALGLSRTTAEVLVEYVTDKDMTMPQLRQWLSEQRFEQLDISPICIREVKGLLERVA